MSKANERWRKLITGAELSVQKAAKVPATLRCPLCGEAPFRVTQLSVTVGNETRRLVGFSLIAQHRRCALLMVCACGTETTMDIKHTESEEG